MDRVYLGSVNYTLRNEISRQVLAETRKIRSPGSNARLPSRSSVHSRRGREFQRGPESREVAFSCRCRLSPYLTRRFTILHYRSTNYNPQTTFGVYSTGTRVRDCLSLSLSFIVNTMHVTCAQKRSCITCWRNRIYWHDALARSSENKKKRNGRRGERVQRDNA